MQSSPACSRNDIKPLGTFQPQTSRNALRRSSVSLCPCMAFIATLNKCSKSTRKLWISPKIFYCLSPAFAVSKGLAKKLISHSTRLITADSEVLSFSCDPQWKEQPQIPKSLNVSVWNQYLFLFFSQQIYLGNKPNSFHIYGLQKLNQTNFLPLFSFSLISETYAIRKFPPVLEIQPLVVGEACLSYPQVPHSNPR